VAVQGILPAASDNSEFSLFSPHRQKKKEPPPAVPFSSTYVADGIITYFASVCLGLKRSISD
jgi:hypothetical protein